MQSFEDCKRAEGNRVGVSEPRYVGSGVGRAVLLLGLVLCLLVAGPAWAGTYAETLEFDARDLEFKRVDGWDLVSLGGDRWLNRPGEPRLPVRPHRVALPQGARAVSVTISEAESLVLPGEFSILPSRAPQPLSKDMGGERASACDSIHLMSGTYPASSGEYVGTGTIDGLPICDIILHPVRYVPLQKKVVLSTRLRIEVEYTCDGAPADLQDGPDPGMIEGLVSSSVSHLSHGEEKALDLPYASIGETQVAYLIIADSSLAACFEPLAAWKTRKGVPAEIITLDEIEATYSGSDRQARIRSCICDYHSSYGTAWVLLGGDTEFIPERRLYVPLSDKTSIPSDIYYADLDGTWNDDGDLRWGEIPEDGVDMYTDVYVGRAPVSTVEEAETFVNKVLAYEGAYGSPGEHVENMLFLAEILWGDLCCPSDPEYTDGGAAKDMIDAAYVPGDFTVLKLYESLGNLTKDAAVAALNDGRGIVNVNCHGAVNGISLGDEGLPLSSVMSLDNGPAYGLMYATSCMVGAFEQTCIGEAYVRSPAGGGFFIGNSRYGWGLPGSPGEGPSDHYDQSFFETIFVTGLCNLGKAHAYAKHEYVAESRYDDYYRYVMYGLNLFGDPETPLWTEKPGELTVEFPDLVVGGVPEFPVTVTSCGAPVIGTTVCLYKAGDIYMVGDTDMLGAMTFYIEPAEPGTLLVTVTGSNYLPYMGFSIVDDGSVGIPVSGWGGGTTLSIEPNPFTSTVSFAATGTPGAGIELDVFDVRGRRVVGFDLEASESGVGTVIWDGRDSDGGTVSPGIYIVRVSTGPVTIARKALLIR